MADRRKDKTPNVGAGWWRKGQKTNFISLSIGNGSDKKYYVMFKNNNKREGTKDPDYVIFESKPQSTSESRQAPRQESFDDEPAAAPAQRQTVSESTPAKEEDPW